jgi:hypothetical protein
MKRATLNERGQALIMIAFAIVGLVGFTALAIDGGAVFSDRRHSQNASDTAVTAAALERVRRPEKDYRAVALDRASSNGFDDTDAETEVNVHLCSETGLSTEDGIALVCNNLPAGADPSAYVHVHIKSVVHLFFAPVVGRKTVTNHTDAIAWAKPSVPTNYFDGYGIASLHAGCKDPGEDDPFDLSGSSANQVIGAGVLVNATCGNTAVFVQNNSASSLDTTTGVCVHGQANYTDVTPSLEEGCEPMDPNAYVDPPAPDCSTPGDLQSLGGGKWLAIPGNFDYEFPGNTINGAATILFAKGVYCFSEGMSLNAQTNVTSDINENGVFNPAYEGVMFYLPGLDSRSGITFNGGASVDLHAISIAPSNIDWKAAWRNMLIYVNPTDPDYDPIIYLSGNAGSTFTGTIYAPTAHVRLLGNNGTDAGTVTLDSQIIADTVKLSGNTTFKLVYDESNNATTVTPPTISMIE